MTEGVITTEGLATLGMYVQVQAEAIAARVEAKERTPVPRSDSDAEKAWKADPRGFNASPNDRYDAHAAYLAGRQSTLDDLLGRVEKLEEAADDVVDAWNTPDDEGLLRAAIEDLITVLRAPAIEAAQ